MSGNNFPSVAPPVVSGLPNWFARTTKTAESGFDNQTICFWGDSTTATALNFFGGGPLPVTYPTYAAARFVNFHQKSGEALAGTRILNFGNTGAALSVALAEPSAATFNIARVLSANHQVYWPAGVAPAVGDAVTIGGVAFNFVSSGASGNQVAIGSDAPSSISNLVAALNASPDPVVARNRYASRSSNYDASTALDIWSKTAGPAGAGMTVACSTVGALINGTPVLQLPGLIVFCWGINDVRTGTTSQAQLVALVTRAVNRIRAVLPTTDIVLWGPNSFLSDDPTGAGLVSPRDRRGGASLFEPAVRRLRAAEEPVAQCGGAAEAGHLRQGVPDLCGARWIGREFHVGPAASVERGADPDGGRARAADRLQEAVQPATRHPGPRLEPHGALSRLSPRGRGRRLLRCGGAGALARPGHGQRQRLHGLPVRGRAVQGDPPRRHRPDGDGGAVFPVPQSGVTLYNLNTTTTRFGFTGTGLLPAFSGGTVTVFRQKFEWDATIQSYRQQGNAYPYARRFFCPAAGAGYLRLYPLAQNGRDPANALINPATDVIVGAGGFGAITGFTTLAFTGTANWQVSKSGTDFSALKNTYLWLFSTTPQREQVENSFEPIRLNAVGSVANAAYVRSIACRCTHQLRSRLRAGHPCLPGKYRDFARNRTPLPMERDQKRTLA